MRSFIKQIGVLAVVLVIMGGIIYTSYVKNKPPTCTDSIQNGTETGVDCGGTCERVCQESVTPLRVRNAEIYQSSDSYFNLIAYIENQNISSDGFDIPYSFRITSQETSELLYEGTGTFSTFGRDEILVFHGPVAIEETIPIDITFSITGEGMWKAKDMNTPRVVIKGQRLQFEDTRTVLEATLENQSLENIYDGEFVAFLYNQGEVRNISHTVVTSLPPGESATLVFTWPRSYKGEVTSSAIRVIDFSY